MWTNIYQQTVWCLLTCCVAASVSAGPLGLPDSARPGAVRPEQVGKSAVPDASVSSVLEVPAVIDRPFEIDEGPHVIVTQFRLLDAKDLPEFDISLQEIQQRLQLLIDAKPEGFTIGQIQEASDDVTRYYREKGLILAQAVVPVQTVQVGIVDIKVFLGKLGRVVTEGNKSYSETMLKMPFKHLIGKPVTKDAIETALLTLTDFPGLSVFGIFQPGIKVGEADILLKVQEEKHFDVAYRVDNHGLQETGRFRFRPIIEWNNVTGGADRISMTIQQTYQPKNNTFFAFDYDRYLGRGFKAGIYLTRNQFDVGGDLKDQEIFGQSDNMGGFLEKTWIRSRTLNLSNKLNLALKESLTTVSGRLSNFDKLTVLSLTTNFDRVDTRFKGIDFASLEFTRGFNDIFGAMGSGAEALDKQTGSRPSRQAGPPRRDFAAGQFSKVFATASRLQTIKPNLTMLLRAEYQWTKDLLIPLEQYSVGGPDNVRAFPQAQQLFDQALFLSVELIQNMPFITNVSAFGNRTWGELVQLSVFYDQVVGRLNNPLSTEPKGHINFKGAGVQMRFTLPGTLESRFMWAWQMGGPRPSDNERVPQFWGDITYRF